MATISVKTAILSRFSNIDLSKGILGSLLNAFYNSNPETFPYKNIRSLLKALEWPYDYEYVGDYPEDSAPGWCEDLQGVTSDSAHWFFTQSNPDRVWKFPVGHNLDENVDEDDLPSGILYAGIPSSLEDSGYEHFGGLDYFKGHLYVPLHGTPAKIALFDAQSLNYISSANLTEYPDGALPWCAVNPLNGLLYVSTFNASYLHVYKRIVIANNTDGVVGLELTHLGKFGLFEEKGLPMEVSRIQGGVFSKNGHLYLASDAPEGGVMGFDMTTGQRTFHKTIPGVSPADDLLRDELEGITVWDLDSLGAPNIGGQIHLIMLDNDWPSNDDLYFKHFKVSNGDKDKI